MTGADDKRERAGMRLQFAHFGLHATDMDRMERFYRQVLRLFVTDRGSFVRNGVTTDIVFLSADPDEHHQIILASGRPAEPTFNPINQISFKVDTLEALQAFHRRYCDDGGDQGDMVCHGNSLSLYLPDPEGNRVEVYWPTPWYVPQPLVEAIDLTLPTDELLDLVETKARSLPGFRSQAEWRAETAAQMAGGQS